LIPLPEFVDLLRRNLDKEAEGISIPLLNGNADSYEIYSRETGRLAGLRKAREIIDDLVKRINEGRYE